MTLREWCERYEVKPTHPTTECGAVSVIVQRGSYFQLSTLYCLDDYVVSTVSGPVVWLVPRNKESE